MIQAVIKKGKVVGEQVPAPLVSKGALLIKTVYSCISSGTEISGINESSKSLIKKVIEQPDKLKKGFELLKKEGIGKTILKIRNIKEEGLPTGYSLSGIVIALGEGVTGFEIGEMVAAAGAGLANHAEIVDVPVNLVVKIPKGINLKWASSVSLGAIAMQGVRRADLNLGEFAVVIGTGIIGLLTIQLLKISGIRVASIDLDVNRNKIAQDLGVELSLNPRTDDIIEEVFHWTGGSGADVVLFTAATSNSEPLSQSFQMCKKKGKVVLVGVVGMEIKRENMYEKELDFLISTSYGPGRYDKKYEEKGFDYPYAYVRWTENRNMAEYLRLIHDNQINLEKLISQVYPIENIEEAFESLYAGQRKPLLIIINYGVPELYKINQIANHDRNIKLKQTVVSNKIIQIAIVGAGEFALGTHMPNIQKLNNKFRIKAIVSRKGLRAKELSKQFGASYCTTNIEDVLKDEEIGLIFICTRHDSHANLILKSLNARKNVFVEKPLCVNQAELDQIKNFFVLSPESPKPLFFVGYNRRYSKYLCEIKQHTDKRINPLMVFYRMNAGYIPYDHWIHENGGRIVGESCHIIDLMTFLTESKIVSVNVQAITPNNNKYYSTDNKSFILKYSDGSMCTIQYFSCGNRELPKEYMEIHFDGKSIVMEDFRFLKGFGIKIKELKTKSSEKGHIEELNVIYEYLDGKKAGWPIEFWDLVQTSEISFLINNELF